MRAKEYFEGIRAEVVKTDKAREMLERMKAREGAKAQSYQTGGSGGDVSDPPSIEAATTSAPIMYSATSPSSSTSTRSQRMSEPFSGIPDNDRTGGI